MERDTAKRECLFYKPFSSNTIGAHSRGTKIINSIIFHLDIINGFSLVEVSIYKKNND